MRVTARMWPVPPNTVIAQEALDRLVGQVSDASVETGYGDLEVKTRIVGAEVDEGWLYLSLEAEPFSWPGASA